MNDRNLVIIFAIALLIGAGATYTLIGPSPYRTTTVTAATTTTSTTTFIVTSPASCPIGATCASFSYNSTGQVQVASVQATRFVCQGCGAVDGQSYLKFLVTVENTRPSPVLIWSGSGGGVSMSFAQDSGLEKVTSYLCQGLTSPSIALNSGQNLTLYSPACHDPFVYQLFRAGSINVTFTFDWSTNANAGTYPTDFPNSTSISAQFIFP